MSDDIIEFYDSDKLIVQIKSSMVPTVGTFISIKKNTWEVISVSYALDYSEKPHKRMRANVDLKKDKKKGTA